MQTRKERMVILHTRFLFVRKGKRRMSLSLSLLSAIIDFYVVFYLYPAFLQERFGLWTQELKSCHLTAFIHWYIMAAVFSSWWFVGPVYRSDNSPCHRSLQKHPNISHFVHTHLSRMVRHILPFPFHVLRLLYFPSKNIDLYAMGKE
jgi:hypothetical protein